MGSGNAEAAAVSWRRVWVRLALNNATIDYRYLFSRSLLGSVAGSRFHCTCSLQWVFVEKDASYLPQ